MANGSEKAAVCTDCHGAHEILDAKDTKSPIFKFNVPTTCGKCHDTISTRNSSRAFTDRPSPTETGRRRCAPIVTAFTPSRHTQIPTLPSRHKTSVRRLARDATRACGSRRSSVLKAGASYDLSGELSWPGVAAGLTGRRQLRQLPRHAQYFPVERSALHHQPSQSRPTCGQCHPGVTEKFAAAKVHVDAPLSADMGSKAVRWIRRFYLSMIFARHRRHVAAQLHYLAIQDHCPSQSAARLRDAHAHPPPRAARRAVHQFHSCWC